MDLKSSHGTMVNGVRLTPFERRALQPGDTVTLGGSSRIYQLVPDSEPAGDTAERAQPTVVADAVQRAPVASRFDGLVGENVAGGEIDVLDEAEKRRRQRAAREAEIAAMVASMRAPVTFNATSDSSAASGGARGSALPEARSANDGGEASVIDMSGLPLAFGTSRRGGGPPPAKQSRVENGGAGTMESDGADEPESESDDGVEAEAQDDSDDDGASGPAPPTAERDGADGMGAESSAIESAALKLQLPVSHEVTLGGHSKTVTAVTFDPSGARLLSGSADYTVRMYDFGGMDRAHRSFREFTPQDGYAVHGISYSGSGDRFVVCTGSAKVKVYDRDATALVTTIKGDVYITDMANTKGHVAGVSAAMFHPMQRDTIITASADGSIRLWDLNGSKVFDELCCGDVMKLKSMRGTRVAVTAAAVRPDATAVVGAADDGSLQLFNIRGRGHKYTRADATVRDAHSPGGITSVVFAADGIRFATRSGADDCLKIWDVRNLSDRAGPLGVARGVTAIHETANAAWSPDGRCVIAPCEARKGAGSGRVLAFEVAALEAAGSAGVSPEDAAYSMSVAEGESAVVVTWQPRIQQLALGCTDHLTRVFYDPRFSNKGALLSTARAPKRREATDTAPVGVIIAPAALPRGRGAKRGQAALEDALAEAGMVGNKRKFKELRKDATATRRPDLPSSAPAADILASSARTFTQFYMATHQKEVNLREQDPTAVLRAYAAQAQAQGQGSAAGASGPHGAAPASAGGAGGAASGFGVFTKAYAATQPRTQLAAKTLEEEMEEAKSAH